MPRPALIALAVVLCAAAWFRFHDLGQSTFGHIESYTPGIVYPAGISDPPSRLDQWHNFIWAINDVHGPFWYFWMLPYVQAFGSGLTTLRFPSALLGLGAVFFTYFVALRAGGRWTAPLAAAFLAMSGHHVFWSRQARFYSSICFLSVLSTWFLLRVSEGKGRWSLAGYLLTSLAGLSTIYYYWPVMLVQLLWMAIVESRRSIRVSGWQLWLMTVATPLLTLAIYQARPGPYLAREDWRFLGGYFTFGFQLTPTIDSGSGLLWETPFLWVLPPLALLCAAFGLMALRREPPSGESALAAPPTWLMLATAAAAVAGILYAGYLGGQPFPHKIPLLRVSALFPVFAVAGYFLLKRFANLLPAPPLLQSRLGLLAMLGIVPAFMIAAIAQAVDFYAPRGMVCFTPFLLILLARGVVAMGRAGVAVAALLLVASVGSVATAAKDPGAADYAGVAEQWRPLIQDGDQIFISPHWSTTPELYYLQDRYSQIIGGGWLTSDADRVWAILMRGAPKHPEFLRALEQRKRTLTLRGRDIEVALYERE